MTTPVLGLPELAASQAQPHLVVNAVTRALEVWSQLNVISMVDPTDSPFVPNDGDAYIVQIDTQIPEWVGHEGHIAYYSSGWEFIVPRVGDMAYDQDTAGWYTYDAGSPDLWETFNPAGTPAASAVSYDPTGNGVLTGNDVQEALDQVDAALQALTDPEAHAIDYISAGSPGPDASPGSVGDALDELYDTINRLPIGIPLSIPGKPGAGAIYHIMAPFSFRIFPALSGSYGYSGTNATSSSVFSLAKNGAAAFGTITFTSGGSTGSKAAASHADFAAGDRLTITAPASQDATLANVGITLYAMRLD